MEDVDAADAEGSVSDTSALRDVLNGALGHVMVLDPAAAGCILSAPLKELREAWKWTNLSLAVTSGSARPRVDGGLSQLSAPDKTYLIDLKSVQRTARRRSELHCHGASFQKSETLLPLLRCVCRSPGEKCQSF